MIPLGARVRFQRYIDREEHEYQRGHSWSVTEDCPGEGIFIGYRYKQNGAWEVDDWESYSPVKYWREYSRVKVALVVTDPWKDPFTVDPEGLEVIE